MRSASIASISDDDDASLNAAAATTTNGTSAANASTVHLCVILHGLWGSPAHVAYLKDSLLRQAELQLADSADTKLAVFVSAANSTSSGHLYDGFDVCAERVVEEIDAEVERIASEEGGTVEKFSIVGYSLGGVVARYALGILDSRSPSFFSAIEPVNFTTFASPAIGMPRYDGFWPSWFRYLGSRLLSRTGQQLYERDSFLSGEFKVSKGGSGTGSPPTRGGAGIKSPVETGEPLLKIMADPRFSFYRALCKFVRVDIYANTTNDRSVPFCTAALEVHDPFALARLKAIEAAEAAGEPITEVMDLSFRDVVVSNASSRKRPLRFSLPPPLRPSTYPVSRPKALVVISLLPVIWPVAISFLATRSLVHAKQSEWRIKSAQTKIGGGTTDGWLARVGIKLEELVERAAVDNPEYVAALDGGSAEEEEEEAQNVNNEEGSGENKAEEGGVREEPISRANGAVCSSIEERAQAAATPSSRSSSSTLAATDSRPRTKAGTPPSTPNPVQIRPRDPRPPTDPEFSDSQLFQLEHLNAIPQLRKHLVHLPDVYWSHGAIVRRDANFKQHEKGALVVDTWASEFQF
ncbi:hypothetical protein B0A53_05914 [Rhodotorula sp. CCFEE 5036]|nr:hypothetical protein B0A53_05914 [Rhodotorula sp. CCFEE 5036]